MTELIFHVACAAVTFGSTVFAVVKGLSARKKNSSKTEAEQRNDLHTYMVKTCGGKEVMSKLMTTMNKDEKSKWKKTEVLRELGLYARSCGYSWYVEEEWNKKIDEYVKDANVTAGINKTK